MNCALELENIITVILMYGKTHLNQKFKLILFFIYFYFSDIMFENKKLFEKILFGLKTRF